MKPIIKYPKMNKWEKAHESELLILLQIREILGYHFEPFGLKLASKTYYHPDFLVVYPDHFEIHEVKGFMRDDANVKIKVATKLFPWFQFKLFYGYTKRNGFKIKDY